MPANQLITQPRKATDLKILMADGDVMPQTYYLHDVFGEVVGRIDKCKKDGAMFRFRAFYGSVDGRMKKTGMIAVDPNSIILVGEEPEVID